MKTKKLAIFILLFLIGLSNNLKAGNDAIKFGKIDLENLQSNICPIDSNAHAYYIFDLGTTGFDYDQATDKGFQLKFKRHFRIKINDNQGFDWGNIEISLYRSGSDKEEVSGIKAFTYNLEGGDLVKTKLEKSDILTEETSDNWETLKFAMPNLKEGSIIEVEYTITSDFLFNLQEWYFQRTIPTLLSEYQVDIPEYFNYNRAQYGYFQVSEETDTNHRKLTLQHHQKAEGMAVREEKYTYDIDFSDYRSTYSAKNIPAFPKEKFLKTSDNYLTKIEFELMSTQFPYQTMKKYTTSWEEIDERLNESTEFGKELNRAGHLEDDAQQLKELGQEGEDLITAAFDLIRKKISWNGKYNKYTTTTLNKALKNGEGNSADINLNLVMLLRELGFKSYPVILSTQQHGIIHPAHPSISNFNYVIAMVNYNDKPYLMDATDPNASLNLLPIRCLNDKGRIIGDTPEKWVNLMDYKLYKSRASYNVSLDSTLTFSGSIKKKLSDYSAYHYREKIKESTDATKCVKDLEGESTSLKINNLIIEGLDSLAKDLILAYDLTGDEGINNSGDMIYFSPSIDPFFDENPFKLENREFPVEFNYPYVIQKIYTYTIPEKFEISELPKPISVKLMGDAGTFRYQTEVNGNTINVTSSISIKKSMFLPAEYENLKTFMQLIVDKEKELVVLKNRQI